MINPLDAIFGLIRNLKLEYKKWETNSLPLQVIRLILEAIKDKRV